MGVEFAAVAQDLLRGPATKALHHDVQNLKFEDWPLIQERWLLSAVARMSPFERDLMLRYKIIAYAWHPSRVTYCVVDTYAQREALRRGLTVSGRVTPALYRKLVHRHCSASLERMAISRLSRLKPKMSAHKRLSRPQMAVAIMVFLVMALIAVSLSFLQSVTLLQLTAFGFFAVVVGLRCLCLLPPPHRDHVEPPRLADQALPVYTVLVPLFQEISVLDRLLHSLSLLDYPVLCIKRTKGESHEVGALRDSTTLAI